MSKLIILEGIDGAGKTSLGGRLQEALGAGVVFVHHGVYPQVRKGLARLYVEAMMPALLGRADVIMDRSWLSEKPYGDAYRDGADRLGEGQRRMLERIAARCETLVVYCDPGWDKVTESYQKRKGEEYVQGLEKLQEVYKAYPLSTMGSALPSLNYDYRVHNVVSVLGALVRKSTTPHLLGTQTAGWVGAEVLLVGEDYAELTDADPLYQKPFCAFSGTGCSLWLTQHLEDSGLSEADLMWCNADELHHPSNQLHEVTHVFALGKIAAEACRLRWPDGPVEIHEVEHPQSWKRFKSKEPYPLGDLINNALGRNEE